MCVVISIYKFIFFFSVFFFFFKQKTAYEMRISDWSSDVCSSDLVLLRGLLRQRDAEFGTIDAAYRFRAGLRCRQREAADMAIAVEHILPGAQDRKSVV